MFYILKLAIHRAGLVYRIVQWVSVITPKTTKDPKRPEEDHKKFLDIVAYIVYYEFVLL